MLPAIDQTKFISKTSLNLSISIGSRSFFGRMSLANRQVEVTANDDFCIFPKRKQTVQHLIHDLLIGPHVTDRMKALQFLQNTFKRSCEVTEEF